MTGGGGGPIIIRNLIDNPSTTAAQKEYLEVLARKLSIGRKPSWLEQLAVFAIIRSILK